MRRPTPQIPSWGSHRRAGASSPTPPGGQRQKPGAGSAGQWASVLAADRGLPEFAIFGLKRPRVLADTGTTGELRRRRAADMILPQVRLVAAGSPAASESKVTSVSVERRLVRGWLCHTSARRWRSRLAPYRSVDRPGVAASTMPRRICCLPIEDQCPSNTVMVGHRT